MNTLLENTTTIFDEEFTFGYTEEFGKDCRRLTRKFRSLPHSLLLLCGAICKAPPQHHSGQWYTISRIDPILIVKRRLPCKELKKAALRVVLAYDPTEFGVDFLELYAKNEYANEDPNRIENYLESLSDIPF